MMFSTLCNDDQYNLRESMRGQLAVMRKRPLRNIRNIIAMSRALRDDKILEEAYNLAAEQFKADNPMAKELGDGEFMKYFLDWFKDGGWEILLAFIKALIGIGA